MGGNIFKIDHNVIRLDKKEYITYCSEISEILGNTINSDSIFIVPAIEEKDTFGDMDIVIPDHFKDQLILVLKDKYIYSENGNVFSFLYNSFQIDLIFVDNSVYNYACHYFNFLLALRYPFSNARLSCM